MGIILIKGKEMKSFALLFVLPLLNGCFGTSIIDAGHRGVKVVLGKVESKPLGEGLHFYNPIISSIYELDVREKKIETEAMTYTKDVQNAKIVFSLNYRPDPNYIHNFYRDIGRDWAEVIIPQVVQGKVKEVIGQYDAVDLVAKRQVATTTMFEAIKTKLLEKHVVVTNFEMKNVDFNNDFERAVEAKVVAIQRSQEEQNRTIQIKEQKQQMILKAEGEAESMRIRAKALQENKGLIDYEAVQKWNGALPQYMMSDSVLPFIKLNNH